MAETVILVADRPAIDTIYSLSDTIYSLASLFVRSFVHLSICSFACSLW